MANEIHGIKSYLYLGNETTWGTAGTTPYWFQPFEKFDVQFKPDRRNANPFVGLRQRKHGKNFRGMPQGGFNASLYGVYSEGVSGSSGTYSLAQRLLTWLFGDHENIGGASLTAELAMGPNIANMRYTGLRPNTATLKGSADSGIIEIDADLMGSQEIGNATFTTARAIPDDMDKLQEFEFFDATLSLGGVTYLMDAFELQLNNNLKPEYQNQYTPAFLAAGARVTSFQVTLKKNADTWSAYRRASTVTEMPGILVIQGLHNGSGSSGTKTVATITMPRLGYHTQQDTMSKDAIVTSPLQFDVLKEDGGSNDVAIAWSNA